MDAEVLRLRAHIDQTRSEMRAMVRELDSDAMACIIKDCAAGRLSEFDERMQLLVGMLAVVSIFDLAEGGE